MALKQGDVTNFQTMMSAAEHGHLALVESKDAKTGEYLALICAVYQDNSGEHHVVPFGHMNKGNPYEDYADPTAEEKSDDQTT